jgi:hypothetical protein
LACLDQSSAAKTLKSKTTRTLFEFYNNEIKQGFAIQQTCGMPACSAAAVDPLIYRQREATKKKN